MSTEPVEDGRPAGERPPFAAVVLVLAWAALVYGRYLAGYLR
jgi:hypothetical protein